MDSHLVILPSLLTDVPTRSLRSSDQLFTESSKYKHRFVWRPCIQRCSAKNGEFLKKKTFKIIIIIIIIFSIITVFAGVLFVHQPGANHAPRASVTQVNHSVHTLSTFLRIRADPSMQIF